MFPGRTRRHDYLGDGIGEKKKKKDETPAHASPTKSKPTVAVTQTKEVRAASVQRNDGYTKDQAVKKNRTRTQIYKQIR